MIDYPDTDEVLLALAVLGQNDAQLGFGPDDLDSLIARGRHWVETHLPEIRSAVCSNPVVNGFLRNGDIYSAASLLVQLIPDIGPSKAAAIGLLATRGMLQLWCDGQGEA